MARQMTSREIYEAERLHDRVGFVWGCFLFFGPLTAYVILRFGGCG